MTQSDEKRGIDEKYTSATHASSLVVVAERSGPGDVLIAAGWSKSRVGAELMRLHSEYDGAERPPRPTAGRIAALVGTSQSAIKGVECDADKNGKLTKAGAFTYAHAWHQHETALQLSKLKTLPEVRGKLIKWAQDHGMETPQTTVAQVLSWWLNPTCPVCSGRKWEVIPGTPKLSRKLCQTCKGTGERTLPGGMEGAALLGYVKDCVNASRDSMRKRLQHYKPKA